MAKLLDKLSGSTRRVTFGLSFIQFFKAFLSLFTVIISSAYFGTSLGRDVWLLSISIVAILGAVVFGPVFEIFRAKFVMLREGEGESKALRATGSLFMYMVIISGLIIISAEIAPSILGKIFAPTFIKDQQVELIIMIRLLAPTLLFSVTVTILTGLLNVYNVYYVPEIMNIFSSVLNVIIILILAPTIGIYSLVLSGYLSNIILIVVLLLVIKNNHIIFFRNLNLKFTYVLEFFRFALPFYFNYLVAQILLAVERIISTFLGVGNVSVLDYARKFVSIPISVIQGTVNTILTPTLTRIFVKDGERNFVMEISKFMDMMLLMFLPLMSLFIICPNEIVRIFLLRGAFDEKFLEPTAQALIWFGFGILSIIFYSTNAQALIAKGKTGISAIISGILGFFILAINLLFFKKYGIQTLAFSWSFGHLVAGASMYFAVSLKHFKLLLVEFARKNLILIFVLAICYFAYEGLLIDFKAGNSIIKSLINLSVIAIISVITEIAFIYLLKFKERHTISNLIMACITK